MSTEKVTLKGLMELGYEGSVDCNLETSLFEYGLIHLEHGNGAYTIVYGVEMEDDEYINFDTANFDDDDLKDILEASWCDVAAVARCCGQTKDFWLNQPFMSKVHDLISYYGRENVFGSSYYPYEIERD